jgi:transposase
LSGLLWTFNDCLQSFPSLVGAGNMAQTIRSSGRDRRPGHSYDRQHDVQGPSIRCRWKRGADGEAIGRSRGGRSTKIHAVVDGCGRPIALCITPGQRGDAPVAIPILTSLPPSRLCAADTAYDSKALRDFLIERGTQPVIPNNPTRKRMQPFDPVAYRRRNIIERAFCRLKDWRRVATRYDKLMLNFAATCYIAAIVMCWT